MTELQWRTIQPTERRKAVWLTPENAQAVAEKFGGTVQVVPATTFGTPVTRLTLSNTSGPARGYITDDGEWLNEFDWEDEDRD